MLVKCVKGYNECTFRKSILQEKTWINQRQNFINKDYDPIYVFKRFMNTYEDHLSFFRNKHKIDCTVGYIYEVLKIDKVGRYCIKCDNGKVYAFSQKNFIAV